LRNAIDHDRIFQRGNINPYEMIHEKIVPVYKEMKGWNVSLKGIDEKSLPAELVQYVSFLEQQLGVPITLISTGPDRTQTILRNQR